MGGVLAFTLPRRLILVLLLLLPLYAHAWERDVDLTNGNRQFKGAMLYGWNQKLIGDVDIQGLKADLTGDAAIGDRVGTGFSFFLPINRRTTLLGSYDSFDHSGILTRDVTFQRKLYKPGARVRFQNSWVDLTGARRVKQFEGGHGDVLYGMKLCRSELDLRGYAPVINSFQKASWNTMFPIPYLGLGGGARVTSHMLVLAHLKASVLPSTGGTLFTSFDFDLNGSWRMNRPTSKDEWFLTLGFRRFSASGDLGDEHIDIGYGGPLWGLMVRF